MSIYMPIRHRGVRNVGNRIGLNIQEQRVD